MQSDDGHSETHIELVAEIHRLQDEIGELWDIIDQQTYDLIRLQAAERLTRSNCIRLLYPEG